METKENNILTRIDILNIMLDLVHNDIGIGKIPISTLVQNLINILKYISSEDVKKLTKEERKLIREIYKENFNILEECNLILVKEE